MLLKVTTGKVEVPAVEPAVNKSFHLNQIADFVGYPRKIRDLIYVNLKVSVAGKLEEQIHKKVKLQKYLPLG